MGVGLVATSQTVASDQEDAVEAVEAVEAVVAVAAPASRSQTVLPSAVVAGSKSQIALRSVSAALTRRKDLLLVVVEAVPFQKGLRSVALVWRCQTIRRSVWVGIGRYRNRNLEHCFAAAASAVVQIVKAA